MTFSENCKSLGTTPDGISSFCGVPKRTLNTWFNTKPLLISKLFDAYSLSLGKDVQLLNRTIERLKITIDTQASEIFRLNKRNELLILENESIKRETVNPMSKNLSFMIDNVLESIDSCRCFNVLGGRSIALDGGDFTYSTRDDIIEVIHYLLRTLDFPDVAVIEWDPNQIYEYIEAHRR